MSNNSVKFFVNLDRWVQKEMSFTDISYLELWQNLCSMERNHFCNFSRRHHGELFCEIILNLKIGSGGSAV